ncbi:MAG TPA: OsmC family protein [Candidatus Limnocylindrales bacterium]
MLNAPPRPDEPARPPTGFSPTELLLAGAAACSAWDVIEIVRKRRADLAALDVEVEGFQADDPPWHYERMVLHFRLTASRLTVGVLERVVRLSVVRYCSVIATLRGVARIEATAELVDLAGNSSGRRSVRLDGTVAEPLDEDAPAPQADEG